MISAWVHHIAETGSSCKDNKVQLSAQTLAGYAKAAQYWCVVFLHLNLDLNIDQHGFAHPFITEVINQRRAWAQPRQKKEPITRAMFTNAQNRLESNLTRDKTSILGRQAAVHNFTCLGLFTGSRVGEYGQTSARRGTFHRIPYTPDAGAWAGLPIAFIRDDFTFWTKYAVELDKSDLARVSAEAMEVYIRFRYDKSINNFTIRKFCRTHDAFLCPVKASIAILVRAKLLQVPHLAPIGVFRKTKSSSGYDYLTNTDVTAELRMTCTHTYTDPHHYMHQRKMHIMAHSVRVTAAVALHANKVSFDTIAFRLRWSVPSVQHYIRENSQNLADLSAAVVIGAGRL